MQIVDSMIEYKKGVFLEDSLTKEIFEVKKCTKHLLYDSYILKLEQVEQNNTLKYLNDLKNALNSVKMHDKDLFMLENILEQVKDTLK